TRHRLGVIIGTTLDAAPTLEPTEDLLVGHVEEQHLVDLATEPGEDALDALGLRNGADHSIEHHTVGGLGASHLFGDHAEDDLVAHQVTGLHHRPGLEAERGAVGNGIAEQVTGCERGDSEPLGQHGTLGALACPRRAEKQYVHWNSLHKKEKGEGGEGKSSLPFPFSLFPSPHLPYIPNRLCRPRNLTLPDFMKPSYLRRVRCCSIWAMVSSNTPTTIRIEVPPKVNWGIPTTCPTTIGTIATTARNSEPGRVIRPSTPSM